MWSGGCWVEDLIVYDRGDLKGRSGVNASQRNAVNTSHPIDEGASLIHITASAEGAPALLQATRRIRRNIRSTDTIIFLEQVCAVGLPATPFQGAQSVARRIATLLVDIDCKIQTFYGLSALTLWQQLLSRHALVVEPEEPQFEHPRVPPITQEDQINVSVQPVPHLAFLASYPSRRILQLFPYELACRYQCVPVGAERDMLTIGACQQLDKSVIAHIQEVTGRGIFQVRCEVSMIEDVLRYWRSAQKSPPGLM
jgi:hypothetical protein